MKIAISTISLLIAMILLFTGCSVKAPMYTTDFDLINNLKENNVNLVKIIKEDNIDEGYNQFNTIQIELMTLTSPYGSNFNNYIESALETHLKHAGALNKNSNIGIKIKLITNSIEPSIFVTGVTKIMINLKVIKFDKVIIDKNFTGEDYYESSYIKADKIVNGIHSYPKAVAKLMKNILSDDELLKAIKE